MIDIKQLYQKFLDKKCSREEVEYLFQYFRYQADSEKVRKLIQKQLDSDFLPLPSGADNLVVGRNRERLQKVFLGTSRNRLYLVCIWSSVAAAILILLGVSLYLTPYHSSSDIVLVSQFGEDVLPGGNNAYISFSDGQELELDSTQGGLVSKNGKHTYADGTRLFNSSQAEYATVHTPVGGQYRIVLPDGSKAWLNAASSLKYPLQFGTTRRYVETTGEVYFEVEEDPARPFIVKTGNQSIRVLGTAFNVRNYTTQYITTLMHGKIALEDRQSRKKVVLQPGEQSVLSGSNIILNHVDPLDYISWREGVITTKDATLKETCQELERWYAVRFIYPADFDNQELALNIMNREEKLSAVLEMLRSTYQVNFEIKGKEVFVK